MSGKLLLYPSLVLLFSVATAVAQEAEVDPAKVQAIMEELSTKEVPSGEDHDRVQEMLAKMKQEQKILEQQKEELQKLTEQQQQQQQQQQTSGDAESGIAERDENAGKFEQQGTLEKITKKDGTSFYTRIVSSDDTPSSDWGPEYDMPEPGEAGDVAVRGNHQKPKMFTMPANRDMKDVLKEIMANDGDVRKVPGLKPWRPADDKRNENQIGWDEGEDGWGSEDGEEEEAREEEEEMADDGTGVVPRNQGGAATSLSDANHQISMLKIDLQTLKQEKMMKEKTSSLQITNMNQKLQETQRVMEDLKISSKRESDAARDLKRLVDELEEQLATSDEAKKAAEKAFSEKDAALEKLKAEHDNMVEELVKENKECVISRTQTESMARESIARETKRAKKAEKERELVENDLAAAKKELEQSTTRLEAEKATAEADAAAAKEATASARVEASGMKSEMEQLARKCEETEVELQKIKKEFKEDHNLRLLLEEALNVVREKNRKLEEQASAAEERATTAEARDVEARTGKDKLEAELTKVRLQAEGNLLILIGVCSVLFVLLLVQFLRLCFCGRGSGGSDGSGGRKKKSALVDDRDPDVKMSSVENIPTVEPTSKKSKKSKKTE